MLRPLDKSDLEIILEWRNALAVRRSMYSRHEISWNEHQLWFKQMQADESKCWYLYLGKDDGPAGVVYFTEWNRLQDTAFWGFYANPTATQGTGMKMSLAALDHAFNKLRIQKLNADVLASNPKSLSMHKKVGFIEEGCFREQYFNGKERIDVIRLGMLAREWIKNRPRLETSITTLDTHAFHWCNDL